MSHLTALRYGLRASPGVRASLIGLREILMTLGKYAQDFGEGLRWATDALSFMRQSKEFWATKEGGYAVLARSLDQLEKACLALDMTVVFRRGIRTPFPG